MRIRIASVLWVAVLVGRVAVAGAQADAESASSIFVRASAAYEAGDYPRAIEDYARVADTGVASPELFYNLANAYFKEGNLGRAVLWYERSRRLAPRDADLRENLALTRSLLRDKQLVSSEPRWRQTLLAWHRDTTTGESAAAASALYALVCLVGVAFVFRETDFVSRVYAKVSVLSAGRLLGLDKMQDLGLAMVVVGLLGGAFTSSAAVKIRAERSRAMGVVLTEEAAVFSGPSRDASVQFKVHEGTIVSVRDARPGWVRIDLPGDLTGWVDEASLDRI